MDWQERFHRQSGGIYALERDRRSPRSSASANLCCCVWRTAKNISWPPRIPSSWLLSPRWTRTPSAKADAASLLVHLGMTGQLAPIAADIPFDKHTHVSLTLDDGRELRYTDPRRFGRMAYLTAESLAKRSRGSRRRSARSERRRIRRARSLAQRAHQGAAARSESVLPRRRKYLRRRKFVAREDSSGARRREPEREGSGRRCANVLQDILNRAIIMRGSSISDFLDANGEPGEYQRHHRAYGREGKPCYRCRTPIRRVIVAGRSSYFCPKCQPAPRQRKSQAPQSSQAGQTSAKFAESGSLRPADPHCAIETQRRLRSV